MARLKLKVGVGGSIGDHDSPIPGQVIELDDATAAAWADGIRAVCVDEDGNEIDPPDVDPDGGVPSKAKEVVDWIGDDADRAAQAREVELARDEDDRRSTVLEHIEKVLGGS